MRLYLHTRWWLCVTPQLYLFIFWTPPSFELCATSFEYIWEHAIYLFSYINYLQKYTKYLHKYLKRTNFIWLRSHYMAADIKMYNKIEQKYFRSKIQQSVGKPCFELRCYQSIYTSQYNEECRMVFRDLMSFSLVEW